MAMPFEGAGTITSVSMEFSYNIGFGGAPNTTGLNFISNLDCPDAGHSTKLYASPRYTHPLYSKGNMTYAPVTVDLKGLSLDTKDVGALQLFWDNGQHNMQVLLPIKIVLGWK